MDPHPPCHDETFDPSSIQTEEPPSPTIATTLPFISRFHFQLLGLVGQHLVEETAEAAMLRRKLLGQFLEVQFLAFFPFFEERKADRIGFLHNIRNYKYLWES